MNDWAKSPLGNRSGTNVTKRDSLHPIKELNNSDITTARSIVSNPWVRLNWGHLLSKSPLADARSKKERYQSTNKPLILLRCKHKAVSLVDVYPAPLNSSPLWCGNTLKPGCYVLFASHFRVTTGALHSRNEIKLILRVYYLRTLRFDGSIYVQVMVRLKGCFQWPNLL